jgi:predicted transcriptional regulator
MITFGKYIKMELGKNTECNCGTCKCTNTECECYILTEKEYWKSPVRVFTGLTWFTLGIIVSLIFSLIMVE